MQRKLLALVAMLGILVLTVGPAAAITYGQPDEGRHPFVGALVTEYDGVLGAYCSGTLIAPTVFLTAAHCGDPDPRVRVSFSEQIDNGATVYYGTFIANPGYTWRQNDPEDIAVVLLDEPITDITPAQLPPIGLLDELHAKGGLIDQQFTSVGYGSQETKTGPGPHEFIYHDLREFSVGTFNALGPGYLHISQNPSTGNGGTCYGDSGGPNFLGAGEDETTIIAGLTVTGDVFCRATNMTQRLDTAAAHEFLGEYVALP